MKRFVTRFFVRMEHSELVVSGQIAPPKKLAEKDRGSAMKHQIALILSLIGGISTPAQVVITPATPPSVNAFGTVRFTANQPVAWSMALGSQGTIDSSTGIYSAPSLVNAQQSYGGCQVLPNNHIFNTRIDSLPVNSNSDSWIEKANAGYIFYAPDFPINYADGATPVQNLVFLYTPSNDGPFLVPAYPGVRVQSGYFASLADDFDKHLFVISPMTCSFQELYNLYPAGYNTQCRLCTAQSGVKYPSSTYDLTAGGSTSASGTYMIPLTLRLQEVERALATGGTINHALMVTLKNSAIAPSFIWPATAHAYAPWGIIPYGARFRLKPTFDSSKFSPTAQLLLTQLKQYGLILTDGGSQWEIGVEYTRWPASIQSAFAEVKAAVKPTDMEAVDESDLMVSPTSGNTTTGGETVIATSVAQPTQIAQMPVVLTGVTINLFLDQKYIQVGTPAEQFVANVGGTKDTRVTWSMSPAVGSLTADGLYTPPGSVASPVITTVTATSAADPAVAAQMAVTIFPAGTIRIVLGKTSPYTDPDGNIWNASTGYDQGQIYDNGWLGLMPAFIYLYRVELYAPGDMRFDLTVPNGTYQVTGKFASTNAKAPGEFTFDIESQAQIIHRNLDLFVAAGGEYVPVDFTVPATVTNNQLSYVLRHVSGESLSIAAIQIQPLAIAQRNGDRPAPPLGLTAVIK
jgi:hypothetical protein